MGSLIFISAENIIPEKKSQFSTLFERKETGKMANVERRCVSVLSEPKFQILNVLNASYDFSLFYKV